MQGRVKRIEEIALRTPRGAGAVAGWTVGRDHDPVQERRRVVSGRRTRGADQEGLTAAHITAELRKRLSVIDSAFIIVVPQASVPGIGTGGGFEMRIQDCQGRVAEMLTAATDELVAAAQIAPGLAAVFSPYTAKTPQVFVEIDRLKAQMIGVLIQNVTDAIET